MKTSQKSLFGNFWLVFMSFSKRKEGGHGPNALGRATSYRLLNGEKMLLR
jgi:hypothetical protein